MDRTWRALYRSEGDQLLRGRLRWCTGLAVLGALLLAAQSQVVGDAGTPLVLGFAVAYATASVTAWALTYSATAPGSAMALALGYVGVLIASMAQQYSLLSTDAALAPAGFIALMVGVIVLLPWGALPQSAVAVAALAGYAWVLWQAPTAPDLQAVVLVVSLAVVSVAGAELIERYRARSFQRTWQQEELVALARDLAAQVDLRVVVARILEHAVRLVPAAFVGLTVRDAVRGVYRTEAATGPDAENGHWAVGLEVPEDYPPARDIAERGRLLLPEDDPESPILAMVGDHGGRRVFYVTMRYGGEVEGIINFVRKSDDAFDAGEQLLARGLADQAALALRTARLVSDLRQANRLKSEFVSTMSHELRTPLHVILGYAEMAEDPAIREDDRRTGLTGIKTAGRDLLELIENTLEIGKIEAGRAEVRVESVSLPALWAHLGELCARIPRAPAVALRWNAAVPPILLETDPRKLTVVVRNLVGNAVKFTERGHVAVEASREGGWLLVRISDTGIGIRPEDQAAIFEMFRQADQSDTRRHGGSGLGLYIVQRFVEQLGGTIGVESTPGQGSTFTVGLPCSVAARAAA